MELVSILFISLATLVCESKTCDSFLKAGDSNSKKMTIMLMKINKSALFFEGENDKKNY